MHMLTQELSTRRHHRKHIPSHARIYVGLFIVASAAIIGLLASVIAPYNPLATNFSHVLLPPTLAHPFGTDELGRDLLSRIIYGIRPSLTVSLMAVTTSTIVGALLGTLSGYIGGLTDNMIMRFMDILLAFPPLILAIIIVAVLGAGITNVIIAISISLLPQFARISRGSTLSAKHNLYVEGAIASGESSSAVMFRYILPNSISPLIVQATLRFATAILIESSMSFLGIGVEPPTPDWGLMISSSQAYLQSAPYLAIFPGVAILIVVLGFNLLGDGLRDFLDIRNR